MYSTLLGWLTCLWVCASALHVAMLRSSAVLITRRIQLSLASVLLCSLFFTSTYAADSPKPAPVFLAESEVAKYTKTIEKVEAYLSRTQSIIADFTQVAPDGSLASGKFYLLRPGKMRWQYNPPTPVLMVATGTELIYYDYELEQISHIPLAGSLVSFLAKEKIQFSGDVGITKITSEAKVIRIEVAQIKNPSDGKLMLEFTDVPMQLRSMVVTDSTGQVTNVALANAKFNVDIDSELFKFMDPRKPKIR